MSSIMDDPRLRRPDGGRLRVLDPFMGGGTTVVEALRLGFEVVGIDYNPIAWFIVKGETTPVDLAALDAAYERVAAKVKERLLDLYRTRCPVTGQDADLIYAFWVKQGPGRGPGSGAGARPGAGAADQRVLDCRFRLFDQQGARGYGST